MQARPAALAVRTSPPALPGRGSSRPCRAARRRLKPSRLISCAKAPRPRCPLSLDAVEPAEPAIFVGIRPQRFIALPKLADIAAACAILRRPRSTFLSSCWPSSELLLVELAARGSRRALSATAASSLSAASANSRTPSSTSVSVTSSSEMPARARSSSMRFASATSSCEARCAACRDRGRRPSSPPASC